MNKLSLSHTRHTTRILYAFSSNFACAWSHEFNVFAHKHHVTNLAEPAADLIRSCPEIIYL